ncbi:hypothetical protein CHS0354_016644 [Potamilus streckersoni]|uniref:Uncharacterized protein n=1 Tax=Potamilus streckersoni TaxID=2493646 RepID=A0AAE0WEB4_9BIVA|nr:hypothetical protein CHS0354_016644 [Potamilus streckersoni]
MTTEHTNLGHRDDTKQEEGGEHNSYKTQTRPSRKFSIRKGSQTGGTTTSIVIMKRYINLMAFLNRLVTYQQLQDDPVKAGKLQQEKIYKPGGTTLTTIAP